MARAASVIDALVQITVTFAWVHLTGDTSFITIALLCFSSLTVINAVLNLLVRAVVMTRGGETLSQRIHETILEGNVIEAIKGSVNEHRASENVIEAMKNSVNEHRTSGNVIETMKNLVNEHRAGGPTTRIEKISASGNVKEVI